MLTLPETIKVGGHTIKVDLVDVIDNEESCGEFDARTNTIKILQELPHSQKESTLVHEIFHAMNAVFGNDTDSHALLDSFAEQLYQVLKDNKLHF